MLFLQPVFYLIMKRIYRFIFLNIMGWMIDDEISLQLKKCVIIVVPHTSWVDFVIGALARGSIGLDMHFVAKKELFKFPFGWYFRWMGGAPLNRERNENKVEAIASIFKTREIFRLAIAPEGTRKRVERWKTGFYYIAQSADVPVVAVAFNYASKTISIAKPYVTTGDIDLDIAALEHHYKGVIGYKPENSYKN